MSTPTAVDRPDPSGSGRLSPGFLVSLPIRAYQLWISPALPARCRFYPTCSSYAVQALRTRGVLVGASLAGWRLLRCQPFHPGGYDPVPERRSTVVGPAPTDSGPALPDRPPPAVPPWGVTHSC